MTQRDAIYALASGAGRAGVAVIRISGNGAGAILRALAGCLPEPRRASLRTLRDGDGAPLDRALVLFFPAPASFTGEDVAELHVHGGGAVIEAISRRLHELGARAAEPGEFSRRAFLNHRMGLLEAEAIADLVDADTDAQRIQALRQAEGGLTAVVEGWAAELRTVLALQEAVIDFPDETGTAAIDREIEGRAGTLVQAMTEHLVAGRRAERLRSGITICVTGAPNVGKSSLVNRLAREDVSIVSTVAGTTRDLVEVRLVLAGVPVTLVDTAGLRDGGDEIEAEGIRRARARAASAELVMEVVVAGDPPGGGAADVIRVANKSDLGPADAATPGLSVSARTGAGIDELLALLTERVRGIAAVAPHPSVTRARHRAALKEARDHLVAACDLAEADLRGEELRAATDALGRLTGRVDVEDVLDTIFSSFCIGK